ncbi:MAG: hypothetical protein WBH82_00835 [Arcanobacterium sp.]
MRDSNQQWNSAFGNSGYSTDAWGNPLPSYGSSPQPHHQQPHHQQPQGSPYTGSNVNYDPGQQHSPYGQSQQGTQGYQSQQGTQGYQNQQGTSGYQNQQSIPSYQRGHAFDEYSLPLPPNNNVVLNYWLTTIFNVIPALIFFLIEPNRNSKAWVLNRDNMNFQILRLIALITAVSRPLFTLVMGVLLVIQIIAAMQVTSSAATLARSPFVINIKFIK